MWQNLKRISGQCVVVPAFDKSLKSFPRVIDITSKKISLVLSACCDMMPLGDGTGSSRWMRDR